MQIFVPTEGLDILPLLFLMVSYGFILMNASKAMADGSELLLDIFGPGIVGGILIPILGALPDAMMILMSGLGNGSTEEIAEEIQVGLGTLAGSTIMLLCVAFSVSVWLARRQLGGPDMRALTKIRTSRRKMLNPVTGEYDTTVVTKHVPMRPKEISLTKVGATGLSTSRKSAIICVVSSFTYLIIQIPALIYGKQENAAEAEKGYALFGFVTSLLAFFAYLLYTYLDKDAQEIVLEKQRQLTEKFAVTKGYVNMKHILHKHGAVGGDPILNSAVLFRIFDKDQDNGISYDEMVEGFKSLGFEFTDDDQHRAAYNMIDQDNDGFISPCEFSAWIEDYLLHQYLVSLPPPSGPVEIPSSLPAHIREEIQAFVKDVNRTSISFELPSEQRYPLHIWAANMKNKDFVITTSSKNVTACTGTTAHTHTHTTSGGRNSRRNSSSSSTKDTHSDHNYIREITLTKHSDVAHMTNSVSNIRPKLRMYHAGYPVWACASDSLMKYYDTYKQTHNDTEDALEDLFKRVTHNNSDGMTKVLLHSFANTYHLPLTHAQLNFCFYSRDTNFDGTLTFEDFEGLLCSLVDAHIHHSPMPGVRSTDSASTIHADGVTEKAPLLGHSSSTLKHSINSGNAQKDDTYMSLSVTDDLDDGEGKDMDEEDEDEDEENEHDEHAAMTVSEKTRIATIYILVGLVFVTVVSDPMCDVIGAIGNKIGVNPFYVSFIVTPIVSNASEIIATLSFAAKATDISFGTTVSTLLAAATMNNTLCVSIFMGLIYSRGLTWTYFPETITTMTVIFIASAITYRQTIKLWHAVILFLLFPLSIISIYVLNKYVQ